MFLKTIFTLHFMNGDTECSIFLNVFTITIIAHTFFIFYFLIFFSILSLFYFNMYFFCDTLVLLATDYPHRLRIKNVCRLQYSTMYFCPDKIPGTCYGDEVWLGQGAKITPDETSFSGKLTQASVHIRAVEHPLNVNIELSYNKNGHGSLRSLEGTVILQIYSQYTIFL